MWRGDARRRWGGSGRWRWSLRRTRVDCGAAGADGGGARELLRGGVVFSFAGLFDPTELLEKARVEGAALEGGEILQVLLLAERVAAWRALLDPDAPAA